MTAPRQSLPGTAYLVTRRITRRHFLLRPDADGTVNQLYWYFTAVLAAQLGITFVCVQVLSNHMHEVVIDRFGKLSRFYELRNRMLALALKEHRDWDEEVFSSSGVNYVELLNPRAMVEAIAYTIANCVAAFLVRTPRRWPGAKVLVGDIGRRVVSVKRPPVRLAPRSWPERAKLSLVMPQWLVDEYGTEDLARSEIRDATDMLVREAHRKAREEGRSYLGAKRATRVPITARPTKRDEETERHPRFASAGDKRAAADWLERRRLFLSVYRDAWQAFKRGVRDVEFPYGTWKMVFYFGCRCVPAPT